MKPLRMLRKAPPTAARSSMPSFTFDGISYPLFGGASPYSDTESIDHSFVDYVTGAYRSNGVVFAVMLSRLRLFSQARFQWQRLGLGSTSRLFGDRALAPLESPWPGGSTSALLSRMVQDADLGGTAYVARETGADGRVRLRRLRPDWVEVVLTAAPAVAVESDIVGVAYYPGGVGVGEPRYYLPDEVAIWAPVPDPLATYRGMSWLAPIIREIQADKAATVHKGQFFANGATPQMVVKAPMMTKQQFDDFKKIVETSHAGAENAYRTLYLAGGADVTVVGADLRQLDFKSVQGGGETRIAAAGGIHPVIVGLSEGLQGSSLNAGNFRAARRLTGDVTLHSLWQSACAALETIIPPPPSARLWYDARDVPFLSDDATDRAAIEGRKVASIRQLTDGGWTPESSRDAIVAEDLTLLVHTGRLSVQLQPPDATDTDTTDDDAVIDGELVVDDTADDGEGEA